MAVRQNHGRLHRRRSIVPHAELNAKDLSEKGTLYSPQPRLNEMTHKEPQGSLRLGLDAFQVLLVCCPKSLG